MHGIEKMIEVVQFTVQGASFEFWPIKKKKQFVPNQRALKQESISKKASEATNICILARFKIKVSPELLIYSNIFRLYRFLSIGIFQNRTSRNPLRGVLRHFQLVSGLLTRMIENGDILLHPLK